MRFSVIIPLYNKAPYVAKAIGSVLVQNYNDYELIIMDDGSVDNSFEISEKAIEGHSHCHIHRQQNAGVSVARNNAVVLSQGEYLCFLDADDWWEPTFLEEMDKFVNEFPEAGIYGTNYTIVNETKHKTHVAKIGVEEGFERGYINYCKVYANTMAMPLWTGAVCIPRTVFDEMQGFPKGIKLGEDFLLWIRIALKYKVAFLNKPLSYYNQDVDAQNRGVGRLHKPAEHMLWNLDFLADEEKTNSDYKLLIDRLRVCDLQPYYISHKYHKATISEIKKVNSNNVTEQARRFYAYPLVIARLIDVSHRFISRIYQRLKNMLQELSTEKWEVGIVEGGMEEIMKGDYHVSWVRHNYKDRWFADPFILEVEEKSIVLLVEEYLYAQKKGRISKLVIDRNTMQITQYNTILEKTTHLSFPAILRIGGRVYVYPENSAEGRLDLYEYRDSSLYYVRTLCNAPLTDAVITNCFHDNRIYATRIPDPNGNIIGCYKAESILGNYYISNNVEFNCYDARMAGDFFEYKGVVFKPSQNCTERYGKSIELYNTEDGLSFNHNYTLFSKHPRLREGMHTLNSYKDVVVIDVVGYKHYLAGKIIKILVYLKKIIKK